MKSRLWDFVLGVTIFNSVMALFLGDYLDEHAKWFQSDLFGPAFLIGGSILSGLFFWKLGIIWRLVLRRIQEDKSP